MRKAEKKHITIMYKVIREGLGLLVFHLNMYIAIVIQQWRAAAHLYGQSVQDEDAQCTGHLQTGLDLDSSNPLKHRQVSMILTRNDSC